MIRVFDGAMGTMLFNAGLPLGACPEQWNVTNPVQVTEIHRQYVLAGADCIETNTFGANRIKLSNYGLDKEVERINQAAVAAARAACGDGTLVVGSVGPTGKLIVPLGDLSFEEAYDVFLEQIQALAAAGVDYILIETIIDLQEMRAALLAAKAASDKPVICQLSFGADGRTVTGTDPRTAAVVLEAMGADVLGANCSLGPEQLLPVIDQLAQAAMLPISAQPNAGMPMLIDGKTVYPMGPEEMGRWARKLVDAGATFIGGCCGTTPEHVQAVRKVVQNVRAAQRSYCWPKNTVVLASRTKSVMLGGDFPPVVIGERINPTGRKALAEDIRSGNFVQVKKDALAQVRAGAKVLDINMGVPAIDQAAAMKRAVEEVSMLVDVPLSIDTTSREALEAGLRAFAGRALINSVSAEPERLRDFLPLAKKYGAALICLPLSSQGVPRTAAEKAAIAAMIIHEAQLAGLRRSDLVLDALVMTAATDAGAGKEVINTLRLYREQFGCPSVMGLSNISYGLPRRDIINTAFYAMAIAAGLSAPILNPLDPLMKEMLAVTAVLTGEDACGHNFSRQNAAANKKDEKNMPADKDVLSRVWQAVVDGEKDSVAALVQEALAAGLSALEVADKGLTAAMNEVGQGFAAGRCYLPQVMLAAETMRVAFDSIKQSLPATVLQRGTVVLATVQGDIHDLGKNIVAALLENSGFLVIDLGKDVPAERIVEAAVRHRADVVGLCALMTTTMPQIDVAIGALRKTSVNCRIIVGGAVLNQQYADEAGADAYAADGVKAVELAKQFTAKK